MTFKSRRKKERKTGPKQNILRTGPQIHRHWAPTLPSRPQFPSGMDSSRESWFQRSLSTSPALTEEHHRLGRLSSKGDGRHARPDTIGMSRESFGRGELYVPRYMETLEAFATSATKEEKEHIVGLLRQAEGKLRSNGRCLQRGEGSTRAAGRQ